MNVKIDLSKDGLSMFFKDWQIEVLRLLWENQDNMTSSDISKEIGTNVISRSSIVFFLEELFDGGLLLKGFTTGRGGTRSVYTAKYNRMDSVNYIKEIINERLNQI